MIIQPRESTIESDLDLTAPQRAASKRKITEKGIPETLAEIYEKLSSEEGGKLELFIFDVQNLPKIHQLNDRRFLESYSFIQVNPRIVKGNVWALSRNQGITLHFYQRNELESPDAKLGKRGEIYSSRLENKFYGEICNILSTLQERYC